MIRNYLLSLRTLQMQNFKHVLSCCVVTTGLSNAKLFFTVTAVDPFSLGSVKTTS